MFVLGAVLHGPGRPSCTVEHQFSVCVPHTRPGLDLVSSRRLASGTFYASCTPSWTGGRAWSALSPVVLCSTYWITSRWKSSFLSPVTCQKKEPKPTHIIGSGSSSKFKSAPASAKKPRLRPAPEHWFLQLITKHSDIQHYGNRNLCDR